MKYKLQLKTIIDKCLPDRIKFLIKRWYYPVLLKRLSPDKWPYSEIVKQFVKPGDCVVDVGANIGFVSSILANMVKKDGSVISIEPVPQTFKLLQSNIKALGLAQVKCLNYAMSSCVGDGVMAIPCYKASRRENYYESHLVDEASNDCKCRQVCVKKNTLDTLLKDHRSSVCFVKIDVEGHEVEVIKGAESLIKASRPIFLVEVHGDPDEKASEAARLFDLMISYNYSSYVLEDNNLVARTHGIKAIDYIFKPICN